MTLNLFPARAPIGRFTDSTGRTVDVLMTTEFSRALADLLVRVGGPSGMGMDELAVLAAMSPGDQAAAPAVDHDAPATAAAASVAALTARMDELNAKIEAAEAACARLAKLEAGLRDAEILASFRDPFRVNWERPGTIGSLTPNTVKATTLESTVATGTAPLVVASTTQVANLNASQLIGKTWAAPAAIGSTTPAAGSFSSLNVYGTTYVGDGSAAMSVFINGSTSGANGGGAYYVLNAGALVLAMGNKSTITGGGFVTTPYLYTVGTMVTNAGFQVGGAFACNGKAAQGSYALGAAATDLATVIALANNLRTMAINNGTGS